MLLTPVVLLIFNRPDLTEIVFEAIRQAKPKKLLIVADGPRFPDEIEKCQKARSIVDKIDWDCQVLTKFSDINLGCGVCIGRGLDWVFSEVEEAIILEDDCLPSPSFFYFCQILLDYYRYDTRIMNISGNVFQYVPNKASYSYYFSKYPHTWGWATWRRAWKYFDIDMKTWPKFSEMKMIESFCENMYEKQYWTHIFDMTSRGAIDTWDYQWYYACWTQSGFSITPSSNLVSNLGYRSDATHTSYTDDPIAPCAGLTNFDIWDIKHPTFVVSNREADALTFDYRYCGKKMKENDTFKAKIQQPFSKAKSFLKKSVAKQLMPLHKI